MTVMVAIGECCFWASIAIVLYTYCIYPVVLFVMYSFAQLRSDLHYLGHRNERRIRIPQDKQWPGVSIIIAAHNEQDHLEQKLVNLRTTDYPEPHKLLQIIIVSDGSTDRTNHILENAGCANLEVVQVNRGGKAVALNLGVERARHDLLVFSDASTMFEPDAVKMLVRHFTDSRVGAVCGALKFESTTESRNTEGIYWRYESALRLMEGRLGATLTPSGAIYSIRRDAYIPLKPGTVLDDLVTAISVRKSGYQVLYDPEAIATDYAAESIADEFARRVRIATGSFRIIRDLLRVRLSAMTRLAFFSHKVLRWVLPLVMISALASNVLLITKQRYVPLLVVQLLFYLWASCGYLLRRRMSGIPYVLTAYYLVAMNVAFLVGLLRSFTVKEVPWRRAR